jgi:hypothetical protein
MAHHFYLEDIEPSMFPPFFSGQFFTRTPPRHFYGALDMQSVAGRGRGKREKREGKRREKSEGKERRCYFPSTPHYFHVLYTIHEKRNPLL